LLDVQVEDGSKKGVGMDFEPSQDRQKRFVNKVRVSPFSAVTSSHPNARNHHAEI
jgi:hypothetical protein